jgi:hypothetical protein
MIFLRKSYLIKFFTFDEFLTTIPKHLYHAGGIL